MAHIPVLLNESIEILNPENGSAFIDATANGGGHTEIILKKMSQGAILISVDRDGSAIKTLKEKFGYDARLKAVEGNFKNLKEIAKKFTKSYDGILFDLGMSSNQLNPPSASWRSGSGRGFSFLRDEPLLMTYESELPSEHLTAAEIINTWPEEKLREIFWKYGEEKNTRRIAKAIVEKRKQVKILSSKQLAEIVGETVRGRGRVHPATKIFQALRIAVNDELAALEEGLAAAWSILDKGGRLVVISFHSLEDRIVKNFFREKTKINGAQILFKKPKTPTPEEIKSNPRSRSAKLRAILKPKNV